MAYNVFDPQVSRPLHELPRDEAKKAYDWFISSIPERITELRRLLQADGVELDFQERSLTLLHNWFFDVAKEERALGNVSPSPELFSVCNDVAVYISEMLRLTSNKLHWHFYAANSKAISYQRAVLKGFNVKNRDYHVDFDYLICQYAFRIIKSGTKEDDLFLSMFQHAKTIL